jgi:hypothetical protein
MRRQNALETAIIALPILNIPPKACNPSMKDQPEELEGGVRKPGKPTDPKKLL